MMKKIGGLFLIFVTISLLFGEDLNSQLNNLNQKYDIDIQQNTMTAIIDLFTSFIDMF